jgi:hypothetical protein
MLAFALGCNEHRPANEVSIPNDSNVAHASKIDAETNDATNRLPVSTEVIETEGGARSKLLEVWRSTNSTPQQVVNALRKWMPKDTTVVSAPDLLGTNFEISHSVGPSLTSFDAKAQTNSGVDYFELKYHLSRGDVTLRFSRHGGLPDVYFENAYSSD